MFHKRKITLMCLIVCCTVTAVFAASNNIVLHFSNPSNSNISDKWQVKKFKGLTDYSLIKENGVQCIAALSKNSASGLFHEIKYSLADYPFLSWKWRISNILSKGDATKKEADDYAARIYVIFPNVLFWRTKVINYIWANKLPKGKMVVSTYTENDKMIAVQSGADNAEKWVSEKRNIYQDYIKAFGHEPPEVGAIAIMSDTDNTGQEVRAWYGPISLSKE